MGPLPSPPVPLLLLLLLPIRTLAAGINCRGSAICHPHLTFRHAYPYIPTFNLLFINGTSPPAKGKPLTGGPLPPNNVYYAYDRSRPNIACITIPQAGGGFCVFLQNNVPEHGVRGEVIRERMQDLVNHGCQECGSVPVSGDNNPDSEGILPVNWVSATGGCHGVC